MEAGDKEDNSLFQDFKFHRFYAGITYIQNIKLVIADGEGLFLRYYSHCS